MSCGAVASFDYALWIAIFPEFTATVNGAQAQEAWNLATTYHRNDGSGLVKLQTTQTTLLNMLTAHVAQLLYGSSQGPATQLVGHVNSASEGSVSVGVEMPVQTGTAAWFMQTKYGVMYWTASAAYRSIRYLPRRGRNMNPFPIRSIGGF